ncbi:MAG: 2-C-methyl-D-erythritol 4-phosphate cytidylyltransferase [Dehalococcoidales bacterium]|nr:2-C-methyl-D-erythritol 4-phosphate cytidylyltransferase [Dehalococcoidales bacterium]
MADIEQEVGAVIVGAGRSKRMGDVDKIFAPLAGQPVLLRVLQPFIECPAVDRIVVVLNGRNYDEGKELIDAQNWEKEVAVCTGGRRRQDSVLKGLKHLGVCDYVVIHDGARPLVTIDLIERGLKAAKETGAAVAALPATDTIKLAHKDMASLWTLPRGSLWTIQTPQVFQYDLLMKAYREAEEDVTDDAQLIELTGGKVKLYTGAYDNIKITTPDDMAIAETLWKRQKA